MTSLRHRVGSVLPWALAVAPPLVIADLVARHARNVPWKDQWGLVPFMADASRGHLPPDALWAQVNEHRIPLTMLLQGALAWATRWDVRYEAWANVVLAGATLAALAGTAVRTVGPPAPRATPWLVLACSILVFALPSGINWGWGSMNATYLAGAAAATLAWQLAGWRGTWPGTSALAACATAGALSFGAGVVLLVLLPAALLAHAAVPARIRLRHALAAAAWGALVLAVYLHGWHPRTGEPPPVWHPDRLADYARYLVAYLGGGSGASVFATGFAYGVVICVAFAAASVWLWWRDPAMRAAALPWWLLAGYGVANGVLAAYGRLDNGLLTALFVRYRPTATFFLLATLALTTLAGARLWRRWFHAGVAAATLGGALVVALVFPYVDGARIGTRKMRLLAEQLEVGAACLPSCATASDGCLLHVCWSAQVARQMCPIMQAARIGPFAP